MPKWIVICAKCKTEFEESKISEVGMVRLPRPTKPEFARTGNDCVCPNCGYAATYFPANLMYRA
jgi:hypothetical protein